MISDIVVIGAGPVGLYAAFFAAKNGFSIVLVDALAEVGGQLTALYPQKSIFDVAGYPKVTAGALVEELKKQVTEQNVSIHLNFRVIDMARQPNGIYEVRSEDERHVEGRYVIIAAGAGMITPRKLELASAEQYVGRGLEYVVKDIDAYRDKRVLVIGGGDTALDWADFFLAISKEVTLIHRSDRFAGFEGTLRKLEQSSCTIYTNTRLTAIHGEEKVEQVEISNNKEGWTKELQIDQILGCIGFTPKLGFLKESGVEIAEGSIRTDGKMRTCLENVYAVGDISNHPGRLKLISTGFGNVQVAVDDIRQQSKN